MDPRDMEALVQRLVQNPHDQDAIVSAHRSGLEDPRSYAMLLEKVGTATSDPAFAAHWLTEAAKVWSTTLGDSYRAVRALTIAVDRDPAQAAPAEMLADIFREKGDIKALAAMLERRTKALAPLAAGDPELKSYVAGLHEELGRLWSEPPLANPAKAIESYRHAIEYDPLSQFAIYGLREALKAAGRHAEAIPYFSMERKLAEDIERKLALYQDEAEVRAKANDFEGAVAILREARELDPLDPTLKRELATLILERGRNGSVPAIEQAHEAAALFVDLAERYPGDVGFAYASCALELHPGNERAAELAREYGETTEQPEEDRPLPFVDDEVWDAAPAEGASFPDDFTPLLDLDDGGNLLRFPNSQVVDLQAASEASAEAIGKSLVRYDYKVPKLSPGIVEVEIVSWFVKAGDMVSLDQDMVEVMSDKGTVTLGAPVAGMIAELRAKPGDVFPVGQVLIVLDIDAAAAEQMRAEYALEAVASKSLKPMTSPPPSIFIIENDPVFAAKLERGLEGCGCSVTIMNDEATVAGRLAGSGRPDLILLTIELRNRSGFDVYNELKTTPGLRGVPVVILSSSTRQTFELHRDIHAPPEGYVQKPVTFEQLLTHLTPLVPFLGKAQGRANPPESARGGVAPAGNSTEYDHLVTKFALYLEMVHLENDSEK